MGFQAGCRDLEVFGRQGIGEGSGALMKDSIQDFLEIAPWVLLEPETFSQGFLYPQLTFKT